MDRAVIVIRWMDRYGAERRSRGKNIGAGGVEALLRRIQLASPNKSFPFTGRV
jgi:hypothetical protein